jgi:hypothetical protein
VVSVKEKAGHDLVKFGREVVIALRGKFALYPERTEE